MRAVNILDSGLAALTEQEEPSPGLGELLLEPLAVGLCGTDVELLQGDMVYLRSGESRLPLIPGHEWAARVVSHGPGVRGPGVGQLVVGECSVGCGQCGTCRGGAYHRCRWRRETGILKLDGALATRMVFPARSAHVVPDGVGIEDAALVEPCAVAYRALQRAGCADGCRVLVIGAGTIGWLCISLLRSCFGADVSVVEPDVGRLERASASGCRIAGPTEAFDRVVVASGAPEAILTAQGRLAPGGRMVLVGLTGRETVPLDTDALVVGDQELVGTLGSPGVWPDVLALLGHAKIRPSSIVTHRYPLGAWEEGFAVMRDRSAGAGKVLVFPQH